MLPPNQTRRSVREPWFALLVLAACATTPVTSAALHRPWIVRSAIAGADGEAIEVLGAPGPRSLLLYLFLHYEQPIEDAFAKACNDEGLLLQDVYQVGTDKGELCARLSGFWGNAEPVARLTRSDLEALANGPPARWLTMRCSLATLAMLLDDVWWRWPIPKGQQWMVMRPWKRSDFVGPDYAAILRVKIERGMSVEAAFEELLLLDSGLHYALTMPRPGRLRVVANGTNDAWEGDV